VVSHHCVEGVHRPVGQCAGGTRHCGPERRSHDGIDGVLGHRFDHRPGNPFLVEIVGAASNQSWQESSSLIEISELQGSADLQRYLSQHLSADGDGGGRPGSRLTAQHPA
jgi:hypothetical protein